MAVWTCGSINIDNIYTVPHLPKPGETISSTQLTVELGGKGANQSIAVARAGGNCSHIGSIGEDAVWTVERLKDAGVDTTHVRIADSPTGHANIYVDVEGENQIVLYPGANHLLDPDQVRTSLKTASRNDILLVQNETNTARAALQIARDLGMTTLYSAAPFDLDSARDCIELVDILLVNDVEISQLEQSLDIARDKLSPETVIVTKGAEGVEVFNGSDREEFPAIPAQVIDTTGAGDCFAGYLAAGFDQGLTQAKSVKLAIAASSLQVEKKGTAEAIPMRSDVDLRLKRG